MLAPAECPDAIEVLEDFVLPIGIHWMTNVVMGC
jgi:hypothetical protein